MQRTGIYVRGAMLIDQNFLPREGQRPDHASAGNRHGNRVWVILRQYTTWCVKVRPHVNGTVWHRLLKQMHKRVAAGGVRCYSFQVMLHDEVVCNTPELLEQCTLVPLAHPLMIRLLRRPDRGTIAKAEIWSRSPL